MRVLLFYFLVCYADLSAQDSTLVTIKAGYKVKDVLTPTDIYQYSEFKAGKVFFKDGSKAAAKMNYSRLFDQILFIDPKSDTLALADEKTIKFLTIDKDTFYYDNGYMRIIGDKGAVKLLEKQTWVVADVRKIGTFNRQTTTVAVHSLSDYTNGSDAAKSKDLILNEDIILRRETQYFFGDDYYHFARAGKKGLFQLYGKDQRAIENYLNENKINFDKREDIDKLVDFLGKL